MSEDPKKNENEVSIIRTLGIAVSLPSTILGVFFVVYYLIEKGTIPSWLGMMLIVVIIVYLFYLMVRNVYKKK